MKNCVAKQREHVVVANTQRWQAHEMGWQLPGTWTTPELSLHSRSSFENSASEDLLRDESDEWSGECPKCRVEPASMWPWKPHGCRVQQCLCRTPGLALPVHFPTVDDWRSSAFGARETHRSSRRAQLEVEVSPEASPVFPWAWELKALPPRGRSVAKVLPLHTSLENASQQGSKGADVLVR